MYPDFVRFAKFFQCMSAFMPTCLRWNWRFGWSSGIKTCIPSSSYLYPSLQASCLINLCTQRITVSSPNKSPFEPEIWTEVVAAVFLIVTIAVVWSHYPLRPGGQPRFRKGSARAVDRTRYSPGIHWDQDLSQYHRYKLGIPIFNQ